MLCAFLSPATAGTWTAHEGQGAPTGTPPILVFTDQIMVGDAQKLEQAIARHRLGIGMRVHMISQGGDVDESLRIGRVLRRHAATVTHGHQCASSCVLAFLGGTRRIGNASAQLVVHQPEATQRLKAINTPAAWAVLNAVKDYTVDMLGTRHFYDAMIVEPFGRPRALSFHELSTMRVVTEFDR